MKHIAIATFFAVISVSAQDRERGPRGGFGSGGGFMRMNPVLSALDADHDGTISAEELSKASTVLKALDKNGDGELSAEELRPNFGPGGPRGGGPEEMVKRLMEFDRNSDGKLDKSEVPERMQGIFARGDKDSDGVLTAEEIKAMASAQPSGGGPERGRGGPEGGRRGPGGPRMDPVMTALDTDGDHKISAAEIQNAASALAKLDKNADGKLVEEEVRPNMEGMRRGGPERRQDR